MIYAGHMTQLYTLKLASNLGVENRPFLYKKNLLCYTCAHTHAHMHNTDEFAFFSVQKITIAQSFVEKTLSESTIVVKLLGKHMR